MDGDKFFYAGNRVPIGGEVGEVLAKIGGPHYYTGWRTIEKLINQERLAGIISNNLTIDEGDY